MVYTIAMVKKGRPPMRGERMDQEIKVRLLPDEIAKLKALAAGFGTSVSHVVRFAIECELNKKGRRKK